MLPRRAHLQNNQCSDCKCAFKTSIKGAFHQFNRLVAPQHTTGEKGWTDMTSSHAWCIFRTNNQETFGFRCKNWSVSPRTLKTWKPLYSSVGQKKPTRLRGLDVSQEVYELCQAMSEVILKPLCYVTHKDLLGSFHPTYHEVLCGFEIILPEDLFWKIYLSSFYF